MGEMTEKEHFEASMELIEGISNACEGADYFDMLFALAAITAELIDTIKDDIHKDTTPLFLKLLKDHMTERPEASHLH